MKPLEDIVTSLLKIESKFDGRIYEVGAKIIYYLMLVELTLWYSNYNGYPINDLFSVEALNNLFAQYRIVILLLIFIGLFLAVNISIFLAIGICSFLITTWTIISRVGFGKFYPMSKNKEITLLNRKLELLNNELNRPPTVLNENPMAIIRFIVKFTMVFFLVYVQIISSQFPSFYSQPISTGFIVLIPAFWLFIGQLESYNNYHSHIKTLITSYNSKLDKLSKVKSK